MVDGFKNCPTISHTNYLQDLVVRIVLNTFLFLIFKLLSRKAIFLVVFMKNNVDPLGVNFINLCVYFMVDCMVWRGVGIF